MKVINTLTINGHSYQISDPNAAKIDDANIGGKAWSSKKIVDKLCPPFSESGTAVRCEPVEGYPLSITAEEGATTISRCGKNLIDYENATGRPNGNSESQMVTIIDNGVEWVCGTYYFAVPCNIKAGEIVVFSCVNTTGELGGAMLYNTETGSASSTLTEIGRAMTAKADANYIYIYSKDGATAIPAPIVITNLQLEYGTVATAYEPYKGVETFAPGEIVPALSGVNTIWADSGEITVTGKSDPVAIIEKLTNAVISLGGNI